MCFNRINEHKPSNPLGRPPDTVCITLKSVIHRSLSWWGFGKTLDKGNIQQDNTMQEKKQHPRGQMQNGNLIWNQSRISQPEVIMKNVTSLESQR